MRDHIAQRGIALPLGIVPDAVFFTEILDSNYNIVAHFKNLKP